MSDLDWLRKVIEGRSKGPWSYHNNNALKSWLVYPSEKRYLVPDASMGPSTPRLYPLEETEPNARFIATLGTTADLIMDVLEAAEALFTAVEAQDMGLKLPSSMEKAPGSYADLRRKYQDALAKLKAAKPVEET